MRQRGRQTASQLAVIPLSPAYDRLQPPDDATNVESDLFAKVVASVPRGHFVQADDELILSYVQATLAARCYQKALSDDPKSVRNFSPCLPDPRPTCSPTAPSTRHADDCQVGKPASRPLFGQASMKPWAATMTKRRRIPRAVIEAYEAEDDDTLRALLDLKPWEVSPLDADGPCPYSPTSAGARSWPKAMALQEEFARAAAE